MASSAVNIKVEPVNVFWRIEEQETLDFTGLTSAGIEGKSLNMSTALDAILNYLWWDEDTVSVDPAIGGRVSIEVDIVGGDADTVIASKTQVVVDALPGYTATVSGAVVTVIRAAVGDVTDTVDTDSGVLITKCQDGGDFDLGLLDGDVAPSFEESLFDVTSHQTGTTVVAALRQGNSAEITTILQETISSKLKEFWGKATGGTFTPGGGTEVFGQGSSRQGENALIQARRLVLKPVNSTDDLSNLTFWKAYPLPSTLTFSGENPKLLEVTWRVFNDSQRDTNISLFAFGDETQTGL